MIIVDNAAYSFGYQIDSGIPIISWSNDPYDKELLNLMDYIRKLAAAPDMQVVNRETFHLSTFYEDYISEHVQNGARRIKRGRKKKVSHN
jgi:CTD small phosphatase-like protein 2